MSAPTKRPAVGDVIHYRTHGAGGPTCTHEPGAHAHDAYRSEAIGAISAVHDADSMDVTIEAVSSDGYTFKGRAPHSATCEAGTWHYAKS